MQGTIGEQSQGKKDRQEQNNAIYVGMKGYRKEST